MRKITVILTALLLVLLLCACQCEHDWAEADCTTPRTCTLCGETDGKALGHDWAEATCTAPKTCTLCGATEGEALGHTNANEVNYYQKTWVCAVCGEVIDEPLEAFFEKYGLKCYGSEEFLDTTYDYVTITYEDDPPKETVGKVTCSDYEIFTEAEGYEALEGYEWRTVHVEITFSDENAINGGVSIGNFLEEYNNSFPGKSSTSETQEGRIQQFGGEGSYYVVYYNGEYYDLCLFDLFVKIYAWENNIARWSCDFAFRVPVGFDEAFFGFYNKTNTWEFGDGKNLFDVADEDTLIFLLD